MQTHILGEPGDDNATFVRIDTGQAIHRVLFDCGEGCPNALPHAEVLQLDHLCFSHFHMDHIAGFDSVFRRLYNRTTQANVVWGPPGTIELMHHRFRGFLWNLYEHETASWIVRELHPTTIRSAKFLANEPFVTAHQLPDEPRITDRILSTNDFTIDAYTLDHGTPSIAYFVQEADRVNIDTDAMTAHGWRSGAWLKRVRGPLATTDEMIDINGESHTLVQVQTAIRRSTRGDSMAYLTDFRMNAETMEYLTPRLRGVGTIVCECQYTAEDVALAEQNKHLTAMEAATLAATVGAERLILFHMSDRYAPSVWHAMLKSARSVFAKTIVAPHWEPRLRELC